DAVSRFEAPGSASCMEGNGIPAPIGLGPWGRGVDPPAAGGLRSGTARPLVLGMDPEKGGGGCVRGRRRLDGKGGVALGERRDRHYVSPSDDGPDGRAKAPGPGDRID